jgi:KaiC/GvpD/RAD55 family RecA-like ATPase
LPRGDARPFHVDGDRTNACEEGRCGGMTTRTIPVDIEGLNLVLGGGIPVLKRHPDYEESATLLVRGAPGSGKTIFGVQLAGSLGRELGCDVAYGCVELLPSELAAQHAGIKRSEVSERVVTAPFPEQGPRGGECRIFAEMLDIGASGEEAAKLGDAIERVLAATERAGGKVGVLVLDSLSDGYNLGSSAPRELADALCKMAAQRGLILILLEEIIESKPSAWSFAADSVIELSLQREEDARAPFARRLAVSKHRFSACEPGPHRFTIAANQGVYVLPHPATYIQPLAQALIFPELNPTRGPSQNWCLPAHKEPAGGWPLFSDCVTAVYGSESQDVFAMAAKLGTMTETGRPAYGAEVILDFSRNDGKLLNHSLDSTARYLVGCGDPFITGDWLVATATTGARAALAHSGAIRRVLIGDLQSLRTFRDAADARQALMMLVSVLRKAHVPVILFETSVPRTIERSLGNGQVSHEETGALAPPILDFADVAIEIIRKASGLPFHKPNIVMTHVRTGRVLSWNGPEPQSGS